MSIPPSAALGFAHHAVHRCPVDDIRHLDQALAPQRPDLAGDAFRRVAIAQRIDDDVRPGAGQLKGDGAADVAGGSRHESGLPSQ